MLPCLQTKESKIAESGKMDKCLKFGWELKKDVEPESDTYLIWCNRSGA